MEVTKTKKTKRGRKADTLPHNLRERLDFSVEAPPATPRFSLNRHQGAQFTNGMWVIQPGGAIQFRLRLAQAEHTIFALEMYSSIDAWIEKWAKRLVETEPPWLSLQCQSADSYSPLMITVSKEDLSECGVRENHFSAQNKSELNPLSQDFLTKKMLLAPAYLKAGDNFLTMWLSEDAGVVPLLLKSAWISDFVVERQQESQWCWAAVTASLMEFMAPERAASQSEVVVQTLKPVTEQTSEELNRPEDISKAAETMQLEEGSQYGNVSRKTMREMVNESVPLPIQINWRHNGRKNGTLGEGHYIAVTYVGEEAKAQTLVQVEDPLVGRVSLTWGELKDGYPGQANQHLYRHQDQQKCNNWKNDACQCQWHGKWTYTHIMIPQEWMEDSTNNKIEDSPAVTEIRQRLQQRAERKEFPEFRKRWEQAQKKPTLAELATQIENYNYQIAKLTQQGRELQQVVANLEHLRQSLTEESSSNGNGNG